MEQLIRVLLVDSDETSRDVFMRAVLAANSIIMVSECFCGEDVLRLHDVGELKFDALVVDNSLADMQGMALCCELVRRRVHAELILLAENWSSPMAVEAFESGITYFICKDPNKAYLATLFGLLSGGARRRKNIAFEKNGEVLSLKAQEALRHSEERFCSVVRSVKDAVITVDNVGIIISWNRSAEQMFGYDSGEAVGMPLECLIPKGYRKRHKSAFSEAVTCSRVSGVGMSVEAVALHKDGHKFPVELSLSGWQTKEGLFYAGVVRDVSGHKQAEAEIRHLSRQLICGIEEERKRLARDLHDELGQAVTALHMSLEALGDSLPKHLSRQKQVCEDLVLQVEALGNSIRHIAAELRPYILDLLGLLPAIGSHIEDFLKRNSELRVDFQAIGVKKRPSPEVETVLYRVVQESLNNIVKHACAQNVQVFLTYSHPNFILTIKDDGVGFEQETHLQFGTRRAQGVGLLGMRERVASVNGRIDILSGKGKGTVIWVETPGPETDDVADLESEEER